MIGEIGGEALRPVAAVCVDVYAVAPPVVQYLVRKRAVQDERQADHTRPEQRERRHAVTRLPIVFHEREFAVRIGAEQAAGGGGGGGRRGGGGGGGGGGGRT